MPAESDLLSDINYSYIWPADSKEFTKSVCHILTKKATNTVILFKQITEDASVAVVSVKLTSQASVFMGILYISCQGV